MGGLWSTCCSDCCRLEEGVVSMAAVIPEAILHPEGVGTGRFRSPSSSEY